MTELLSEYQEYLKLKDYKPRTIEEQRRDIKRYLEYAIENNINIYTIGIRDAERYREHLRLNGTVNYNPKTINKIISFLRLFYTFLITKQKAFRNPFNDIEKMKESFNLPKNILTIEEMEKLLNGIELNSVKDFEFKVIVELLYSTGARISEIEKLTQKEIDLRSGFIKIHDDKERQERKAALTEYALGLLRLFLKNADISESHIFQHGKDRTLNKWMNHRLRGLTKKLKLPYLTCHGIRHSIATHMFKKGADIREVSEFLGHRRLKNTEIYTHIFPDDLKEVVEKNLPREKEYARGNK